MTWAKCQHVIIKNRQKKKKQVEISYQFVKVQQLPPPSVLTGLGGNPGNLKLLTGNLVPVYRLNRFTGCRLGDGTTCTQNQIATRKWTCLSNTNYRVYCACNIFNILFLLHKYWHDLEFPHETKPAVTVALVYWSETKTNL